MTDDTLERLKQLMQAEASRSTPIDLVEITGPAPARSVTVEPDADVPFLDELQQEPAMQNPRTMLLVAAAAVIVIIGAVAFTVNGDGSDVAADGDESTVTSAPADTTTTTVAPVPNPDPEPVTAVELATAYWEAVVAGDRDRALAAVDPAAIDSESVPPFG
ncbi:MAG: hypothetical protein AAF547_19585, partial [Actinomycetota bacterium]